MKLQAYQKTTLKAVTVKPLISVEHPIHSEISMRSVKERNGITTQAFKKG